MENKKAIVFIDGENNNEKSEIMYANQQKLFRNLQAQNVVIAVGQLIKHPDRTYHEKGVDVRQCSFVEKRRNRTVSKI